jgi:hypothetical protein
MHGEPKQGQTLEQVRDLLLEQVSSCVKARVRRLADRGRGE